MEIIKKIGLAGCFISLAWFLCFCVHFLVYMAFNISWDFNKSVAFTSVPVAIGLVLFLGVAGFAYLSEMRGGKMQIIVLWIFGVSLCIVQIFIFLLFKGVDILPTAVNKLLPLVLFVLFLLFSVFISDWDRKKVEEKEIKNRA